MPSFSGDSSYVERLRVRRRSSLEHELVSLSRRCRPMSAQRTIARNEDPVCGMTVDPAAAREKGLTLTHEGTEYAFCGKGCLLEFREGPERFLNAEYQPSM
jgi:YHS domain-containing protein